MTEEEFSAFRDKCKGELQRKQEIFYSRISGSERWYYDLASCRINFDEELFSFTLIGTFNAKYKSWFWGWANKDFPTLAREKSKRLLELADLTGSCAFTHAGVTADANYANDLIAFSVHHLGSIGYFRKPSDAPESPTLYLAIDGLVT